MGRVLLDAAPLLIATVSAAGLLGGVKWVRQVSITVATLADVADKLTAVSDEQVRMRTDLSVHVRESDARYERLLGGDLHPRYTDPATNDVPRPRRRRDEVSA